MPRPKRTKVAPSAPAPRLQKSAKSTAAETKAQAPKDGFNDMYDVSDPDEGVVISMRHVKKNNGKGKAVAKLQMSSRVKDAITRDDEGKDDADGGANHGSPTIPGEETLLGDINLDSSSPAVEIGRRDRGMTTAENSLLAIGNFRRRPREPSILGRAAARARSSSMESSLAEDNGLSSIGRKNMSALEMGTFKKRQREPSILGRNVRSSSVGLQMDRGTPAVGSALKIGHFKRRAREPSILGTAQKRQPTRPEYDDEEEDDFNPEDESTPLNLSKTRAMTTSSATSSSNPRKRKLSATQVPESSPTLPSAGDFEEQEIIPATAPRSDEVGEDSAPESPQEEIPMPSIESRYVTPEPMSETMAPPQSSSPSLDSPLVPIPRQAQRLQTQRPPSRGRRALRSKTPLLPAQDSPPSSPPSLTHSPNGPVVKALPKPKAKKQQPPASTFSTAQLQALLPRRRRHGARDPFDIASSEDEVDVSGLASDDDELTHTSIRAPPRRSVSNRLPATTKKSGRSKPALKPPKSGAKFTYSRVNATSDKENDGEHDPDDSLGPLPDNAGVESPENSQELEKRVGKELKRAARKFAEVDEWELDFEDNTAGSSSPKDAR